jgi:hypothetical protein
MREKPILFSGPMVRAILAGTKTQTRRIVKPQPPTGCTGMESIDSPPFQGFRFLPVGLWPEDPRYGNRSCPYGQPGGRLWVREAWAKNTDAVGTKFDDPILYRADFQTGSGSDWWRNSSLFGGNWRPSIFMPRWASRITLEITEIRVQRLQEISAQDAIAEGIAKSPTSYPRDERDDFRDLWDSINANKYPWASNPYVWALTFKKI